MSSIAFIFYAEMQVLSDLKGVEKSQDPDSSYAVGFGMNYKIMDLKAGFNPLDVKETCKAYRNARHRLILLDWGGKWKCVFSLRLCCFILYC